MERISNGRGHRMSYHTVKKESHSRADQWSGAWPHESGQTSRRQRWVVEPPHPFPWEPAETGDPKQQKRSFLLPDTCLKPGTIRAGHREGEKKGHSRARPLQSRETETECRYRYTFWHLRGICRTSRKQHCWKTLLFHIIWHIVLWRECPSVPSWPTNMLFKFFLQQVSS